MRIKFKIGKLSQVYSYGTHRCSCICRCLYITIICNVLTTTPTLPLLKWGCWSLYVWGVWIWSYLDIRPLCMWCPKAAEDILREKPCEGRGQVWRPTDARQWALMNIIWPTKEAESGSDLRSQEELSWLLFFPFLLKSPSLKVSCLGDFK